MEADITPTPYCDLRVGWLGHERRPECEKVEAETSSLRLLWHVWNGEQHISAHAAANPNLGDRFRARVVKQLAFNNYRSYQGALGVVMNPTLTAEEANYILAKSTGWEAAVGLLTYHRDKLTEQHFYSLSAHHHASVKTYLANMPGLSKSVYRSLFYNAGSYSVANSIYMNLAYNEDVDVDTLQMIAETITGEERLWTANAKALANPSFPLERLFDKRWYRTYAPECVQEAIEDRHEEVQAWLAEKGVDFDPAVVPHEWIMEILN